MVSTAAQVNGQVFGVISGLNMPVTLNTGPVVATVAFAFGYNLNALMKTSPSTSRSAACRYCHGQQQRGSSHQAPVDNAIPYLYFAINPLGSSFRNALSFVFDPADPALYLEGKALNLLPLGPVTLAGIGFSLQGQIPYTPVDAPSQDSSTMVSRNIVLQGSVDTTAITAIPSKVAGDIILNLDPNHTDKFLGGANVTGPHRHWSSAPNTRMSSPPAIHRWLRPQSGLPQPDGWHQRHARTQSLCKLSTGRELVARQSDPLAPDRDKQLPGSGVELDQRQVG